MVPHNQLASVILEYISQLQELPEEQLLIESNDEETNVSPDYQAYAELN